MSTDDFGTGRVRFGMALLFVASAFPKAGFPVAGIPLPLMLIPLLGGLVVLSRPKLDDWSIDLALVGLALWTCVVAVRVAVATGVLKESVALLGWSLLPLSVMAVTIVREIDGQRAVGALLGGVRLAVAFGYAQLLFGVKEVAIPGLTQAVGTNLDDKYLRVFDDGEVTFWKIPATYQNGNTFGVVAAVCFAIALSHRKLYRAQRWQLLDLALFGSAVLLAASRTVVLGWGLAIVLLLVTPGVLDRVTRLRLIGVLTAAAIVTVVLQPGLLDRLSFSSITDASGAGRTAAWRNMVSDLGASDWLFGSVSWGGSTALSSVRAGVTEGWGGVVQQVGLIGIVLLAAVWLKYVWPVRAGVAVITPLAVSVVLDSAYLVYPTLFLPAAFVAALRVVDRPLGRPDLWPRTSWSWDPPLGAEVEVDQVATSEP